MNHLTQVTRKKYSSNAIRLYWTECTKYKTSKKLTKKSLPTIRLMAYVESSITYTPGSTK